MTISHDIPSTTRKPGEFHQFDLLSGAQGLTPLANRILLIGEMLSTGTATADEANQIFDENQADDLFGQGTPAALMCRKALEVGRALGFQPEIWAAGIAEGTTAATQTLTVTGTAAAAGDIEFRIAGRTLRTGVSADDVQNDIAAAIKDTIDENLANLPITASVATNVVTLTYTTKGINGEDLIVTVEDVGLTAVSVAVAAGVTGVGAVDPATALANSLARFYEAVAISNHATADITALGTHLASAWAPAAKRWRFAIVGENGTLSAANTLSAAADSERIVVVGYEESPSLPCEIAAAVACGISAREQPNYNWDYEELPLFTPPDSAVFTDTEIETLLAAGTTPLAPNDARDGTEIVRLITTKTTEGGNPYELAKDLATMRGLVYTTRQLDATFSQQFRGKNKSEQVLKRMRSTAYRVLKALEDLEVVQNVDSHFPELIVETDAVVATRAVISVPESIIPNLHQIVFKHVLYVE